MAFLSVRRFGGMRTPKRSGATNPTGMFFGPSGIAYYLPVGADNQTATNCTLCRIDSQDRMYMAGETFFAGKGYTTLLRLLPNMTPDPTFGDHGYWTQLPAGTKLNGSQGCVIQGDGKIVLGGATTTTGNLLQGLVSRVNPDGTADTSFGGTGSVVFGPHGTSNALGFGCAVQSDGKIVVCGSATRSSDSLVVQYATRFNTDGTIDTGYGTSGTVLVDCGSTVGAGAAWNCVCDSSDNVYMGGSIDFFLSTTLSVGASIGAITVTVVDGTQVVRSAKIIINRGGGTAETTAVGNVGGNVVVISPALLHAHSAGETVDCQVHDQTCVKLDTSGALDTSFNGTGFNATRFGATSVGLTCILDPVSGKPIVAGNSFITTSVVVCSKYNLDGTLDGSWGTAGLATVPFNGTNAIWFQPDNKLVLAVQPVNLAARFTTAGVLDTTFGTGGLATIPGPATGQRLVPNGVGIRANGNVFLSGNGITGPIGAAHASSPNKGIPMWAACLVSPTGANLTLRHATRSTVGLKFPPRSRDGQEGGMAPGVARSRGL